MGKKSAPPAPDYTGAANAQAQASQNLAMDQNYANRPNVSTPWGSQSWTTGTSKDPVTGRDVTTWNQNIQLAPEQQQALNAQMRIQAGQSGVAEGLLGQVAQNFNTPMDWGSLPSRSGNVQAGTTSNFQGNSSMPNTQAPGSAFSFGSAPGVSQLQSGVGTRQLQTQMDPAQLQTGVNTRQLQTQVDPTQMQTGVGTRQLQTNLQGNPAEYRQRAQDAVWNLQKPMLDQQRADLENQLVNQGFARDSEGFGREMTRMDDAYARAQLSAIDSGRAEADMAFGQDLQAGQFGNQAQNDIFGQRMQAGQFGNQAEQAMFGQDVTAGEFGNRSLESMFAQRLQSGQFGNQAQQDMFGQDVTAGQFGNQAQKDMFGQGMDVAGFNNQTRGQDFSENLAGANFENIASQGEFDNLMRSAQLGDQQAMQRLQMAMSAGNFNNQNRQGAISEDFLRRSQPLNELNALLGGQQVQMPQFPNFSSATSGQAPNLLGAADMQYGASLDAYNARNSGTSQLANAGMTAAMAYFMSDARLKTDIQLLGQMPNGVKLYQYRYRGLPDLNVGVLAQQVAEVMPEAVAVHPSGYLMVNYSMVLQ